nr:PREDICTED: class I histocompatibility antigen, F10 alpha chain-like [Latimeria chalumnae]|eukprot:XP_014353352.1 PREDICTED: class I histocompatibility antigen, F10 alpha chain-like [Latimeria chalumnae]
MTANSVTRGLHSWRFFETVIVGPDEQKQFIALGTLDNVPVVYYDSNIRRSVPKQPWVEEVAANAEGRRYWNELTQRLADRKRRLTHWVRELKLMKNKTTVCPEVKIYYRQDLDKKSFSVVCMATGFYPPAINVTWVCEGVRQTNVSTTSGILPKEDGTYQITEEIKVGLEEKRSYACHVEHSSLEETLIVPWEIIAEGSSSNASSE